MKKLFIFLLCLSFCGCSAPFVKMKGVKINDNLYARSNLLVKGDTIYYHNMRILKKFIPVGTEIKVLNFSDHVLVFSETGTDKKYRLLAETGYYDKYFVKNKQDIGLDKMPSSVLENVMNMKVIKGMNKEEVLASYGCPAYIGWGDESLRHSLKELLASDTWYYNFNTRNEDCLVTFKNGVVETVEQNWQEE